ncbi:Dicer-like protein 1 [Elsinoe australis]|uniref:Dicer-like protein 1 n=1 Tax=Elsinoe australis TaxID=40998 RepID=A0A2P7Z237_9PEZI|nr:Dicer-like protein 1 [Elsinoe australis]
MVGTTIPSFLILRRLTIFLTWQILMGLSFGAIIPKAPFHCLAEDHVGKQLYERAGPAWGDGPARWIVKMPRNPAKIVGAWQEVAKIYANNPIRGATFYNHFANLNSYAPWTRYRMLERVLKNSRSVPGVETMLRHAKIASLLGDPDHKPVDRPNLDRTKSKLKKPKGQRPAEKLPTLEEEFGEGPYEELPPEPFNEASSDMASLPSEEDMASSFDNIKGGLRLEMMKDWYRNFKDWAMRRFRKATRVVKGQSMQYARMVSTEDLPGEPPQSEGSPSDEGKPIDPDERPPSEPEPKPPEPEGPKPDIPGHEATEPKPPSPEVPKPPPPPGEPELPGMPKAVTSDITEGAAKLRAGASLLDAFPEMAGIEPAVQAQALFAAGAPADVIGLVDETATAAGLRAAILPISETASIMLADLSILLNVIDMLNIPMTVIGILISILEIIDAISYTMGTCDQDKQKCIISGQLHKHHAVTGHGGYKEVLDEIKGKASQDGGENWHDHFCKKQAKKRKSKCESLEQVEKSKCDGYHKRDKKACLNDAEAHHYKCKALIEEYIPKCAETRKILNAIEAQRPDPSNTVNPGPTATAAWLTSVPPRPRGYSRGTPRRYCPRYRVGRGKIGVMTSIIG